MQRLILIKIRPTRTSFKRKKRPHRRKADTGDKPADGEKPDEDLDFESVLFAPDEAKTEGGDDKGKKEEESVAGAQTPTATSESLKTLRDIAARLDAIPENQNANFNSLRK
jgi:hypothetical protein